MSFVKIASYLIFLAKGGGDVLEDGDDAASDEVGLSRNFRLNLGCFAESDLDLQDTY